MPNYPFIVKKNVKKVVSTQELAVSKKILFSSLDLTVWIKHSAESSFLKVISDLYFLLLIADE